MPQKSQAVKAIEMLGNGYPTELITSLIEGVEANEKLDKAKFALECYSEHLTTKESFAIIVDRRIAEE
jgi:hypothetical protein